MWAGAGAGAKSSTLSKKAIENKKEREFSPIRGHKNMNEES